MSYQYVNSVYRLDLGVQPKFSKVAKMSNKRTLYSTMPLSSYGQIFAMGGSTND